MPASRLLFALMFLTVPGLQALAQESGEAAFRQIPWEKGAITGGLGSEAQVAVPEGCMFTGAAGTKKFMELNQNPTSDRERGTVLCAIAGSDGEAVAHWFAVFEFDPSGYVKDDEKKSLDADAILASLKEGNEYGNEARKERGWGAIYLDGWQRAPYYDDVTKNLTWATRPHDDGNDQVLNHSVRLLGRGGVMSADLVVDPVYYDKALPAFNAVIGDFKYKTGHTYAEWRDGDKIAGYGLTALVAGGAGAALVKTGLLQKFGKAIVVAVVGALAAIKRFFTGKGKAPTAAA
jgi:uncharacterized membrane-anchored protein